MKKINFFFFFPPNLEAITNPNKVFANSPVVAEFSTLAILFSTLGLTGGERSWESRDGEAGRLMGRSRGKGPAQERRKRKKKKTLVSVKNFNQPKMLTQIFRFF